MDFHLLLELSYCLTIMTFVTECLVVPHSNSSTLKSGAKTDDSFLYASDFEKMQGHVIISRTNSKNNSAFSQILSQKGRRCIGDLCEGFDDYPHEEVKKIIMNNPAIGIYFEDKHRVSDVVIEERFSGENGEPLCLASQAAISPEKAKNIDNIERVIVNTKEFRQTLITETCSTPNNTCRYIENMITGYKTQCTQRHVLRRLWAIDDGGAEKVIMDNFFIPSCCICELMRIDKA